MLLVILFVVDVFLVGSKHRLTLGLSLPDFKVLRKKNRFSHSLQMTLSLGLNMLIEIL